MNTKPQRWYEVVKGMVHVYDQPYPAKALSVSVVSVDQLAYYRSNFSLSKVWGV